MTVRQSAPCFCLRVAKRLSTTCSSHNHALLLCLRDGDINTPLWVKAPFLVLCWVLDVLYDGKPIQKFWVLETVARIPYFAYISILHLYESVGFWRAGVSQGTDPTGRWIV